jgi:hypothetical protein
MPEPWRGAAITTIIPVVPLLVLVRPTILPNSGRRPGALPCHQVHDHSHLVDTAVGRGDSSLRILTIDQRAVKAQMSSAHMRLLTHDLGVGEQSTPGRGNQYFRGCAR